MNINDYISKIEDACEQNQKGWTEDLENLAKIVAEAETARIKLIEKGYGVEGQSLVEIILQIPRKIA